MALCDTMERPQATTHADPAARRPPNTYEAPWGHNTDFIFTPRWTVSCLLPIGWEADRTSSDFRPARSPHQKGLLTICIMSPEFQTLEMVEGDMPARAVKMVKDWAKKYNRDLMDMWKTQKYRQLPGLE